MNKVQQKKKNFNKTKSNNDQIDNWVNRVLFVLSFKGTNTQNLGFITKVLGIETPNEKKEYVKDLLKMIQSGMIYVPKGLPFLIEKESKFNLDSTLDLESIELCLLHPFQKLIMELKNEFLHQFPEEQTFTVAFH